MERLRRTIEYNKNRGTNRGLLYGKLVSEIIDRKGMPGMNAEAVMSDTVLPFNSKTITQIGFKYDSEVEDWVRNPQGEQDVEEQVHVVAEEEVLEEEDESENELEDTDLGGHDAGVPIQEVGGEQIEAQVPGAVLAELRELRASNARILRGLDQVYQTMNYVVNVVRDLQGTHGSRHHDPTGPAATPFTAEEQVPTAAATGPSDNELSPTANTATTEDPGTQEEEEKVPKEATTEPSDNELTPTSNTETTKEPGTQATPPIEEKIPSQVAERLARL